MKKLALSDMAISLDSKSMIGWDIHERGAIRKARGEDVVLLTIGDPDFDTPQSIREALVNSLHQQRTHYSNPQGEYELRRALAKLETQNTGSTFAEDQFNIFNGASNALYSVLRCIANPGKNVVVCEPYYIGYMPILAAVGVTARIATASAPDFRVDAEAIRNKIDANTVAVLLNTPVNPTGHVVSQDAMRDLYDMCKEREIWLVSDEVYSLLYFETPHVSMLNVADDFSNLIVIDSLSKSHAMTGWRMGWTVTNPRLSEVLSKFASASFFACNQFVQDAATKAIQGHGIDIEHMRREYQLRRDYTMSRIRNIKGVDASEPMAGMFVMLDVHQDGYQFAQNLLDDVGVSVAPGFACGPSTQNHVRVSYGLAMSELERAWDRIEQWVN